MAITFVFKHYKFKKGNRDQPLLYEVRKQDGKDTLSSIAIRSKETRWKACMGALTSIG